MIAYFIFVVSSDMYHIWSSYIIITASANIFERNFRGISAHIFAYGPTDFVGNDFAPVLRDVYLKRTMPMLEAIAVDKAGLSSSLNDHIPVKCVLSNFCALGDRHFRKPTIILKRASPDTRHRHAANRTRD